MPSAHRGFVQSLTYKKEETIHIKTGSSENTVRAERSLDWLYKPDKEALPIVTYTFLALCLAVTIPTLLYPELYRIFGGIEPREHWWQLFTATFEHGWPGFHGSIHLMLNVFLIFECGRPCEKLLGSGRFLILSLLSLSANAVTQTFTEGVNGSSLIIWAWGPSLFFALRWAKRQDERITETVSYQRLRGILMLMYGIIVLIMALLPYLFGWRGNPLISLVLGNLYHLVATGVGIIFALSFRGYLRNRLRSFGESTPL